MTTLLAALDADSVWLWRGQVAIVLGSLAFLILLVPMTMWQYRRFGAPNLRWLVGGGAASLYLTALVSYTALPLPSREDVFCRRVSLDPLHLINDLENRAGAGVMALITSRTFLQISLNIVFFIPWGIGVRGFLRRSVVTTTISGAALSLLIELTQGTGLWYVYTCNYRVADVDDVLMNTLGAFIGAVIAPLIVWWMPRPTTLARQRLQPRRVTLTRRFMAIVFEAGVLMLIALPIPVLIKFAPGAADDQPLAARLCAIAAWLVVFAIPALRGQGSVGLWAVWLVPRWESGTTRLGVHRLLRASVISGPWLAITLVTQDPLAEPALVLAGLAVVTTPFTRDFRGISGWVTGARLVDARTPAGLANDGPPPGTDQPQLPQREWAP